MTSLSNDYRFSVLELASQPTRLPQSRSSISSTPYQKHRALNLLHHIVVNRRINARQHRR
jgi:hypothetical protein